MALLVLDLKPELRILKQFGHIATGAFALLGGLILWKRGLFGFDFGTATEPVAYTLWGLAALTLVLTLVAPAQNRYLYVGLMVLTYPIGFVVSYAVLAILFYLVITPIGLLGRLVRRDPLRLRREPGARSFWVERPPPPAGVERYFRQY